jgi:hypothetical protein
LKLLWRSIGRRLWCLLLLGSAARAACVVGSPVLSPVSAYTYQTDAVQAVEVPLQCDPSDQPTLTFSSPGGTVDSARQRYLGVLTAGNGDRLEYYIPDVYGTSLDPARASFRFQVIVPRNQWGASSRSYSGPLTITVTF